MATNLRRDSLLIHRLKKEKQIISQRRKVRQEKIKTPFAYSASLREICFLPRFKLVA